MLCMLHRGNLTRVFVTKSAMGRSSIEYKKALLQCFDLTLGTLNKGIRYTDYTEDRTW